MTEQDERRPDGPGRLPAIDRRTYLKLAGTATGAASLATGTAAGAETRHGIAFDRVVDMVAEGGCDPTGEEPCDAALQREAADRTLLKFPAGEYRFTEKNVVLDRVNFGVYGAGDVRFVVPEEFNEKVIVFDRGTGVLFENVTVDLTAPGATPGVHVGGDDDVQVHDVRFVGRGIHPDSQPSDFGNTAIGSTGNPDVVGALYPIVRSPDGTGMVKNVVAKNAGLMGAYTRGGVFVGVSHEGTLTLEDCRFEGFPGNGVYASRTNGVVQVEGGEFRNNDVSQVRLGSEGSYVRGATIDVDVARSDSPNSGDVLNARGVRFEGVKTDDPGPAASDCDIEVASVSNSDGGIVASQTAGEFDVTDTRIGVGVDGVRAIYGKPPEGAYGNPPPPKPHDATLRGVTVTGSAAGNEAVRLDQRPDSSLARSCINQSGSDRDGVELLDSDGSDVLDSTIDVTGQPIVRRNSTGQESNITYSGSCAGPTVGDTAETGTVSVSQPDAAAWRTVTLDGTYTDPVVVMGPPSTNGRQPCHVRLRNVSGSSFAFKIEEWAYLDGVHAEETVGYLVVEAGTHVAFDGTRIEAGTAETDHTFTDVGFSAAFDSTPMVLGGAQTYRGADPIVTRQRDVSTTGMGMRVQEEQSRGAHVAETVGYVAIEPGSTVVDGVAIEVGRTPNEVTDAWYDLGFEHHHDSPRLLASMQTADGPDPAGLRYRNLSSTGAEVRVEEEKSADDETAHTTETVGYAAIGPVSIGETGTVSVSQPDAATWHTVSLDRSYRDPVVVMGPPSTNGRQPCHVRLRNVSGSSFAFKIEEWAYLDGVHAEETVGYLVVEAGTHVSPEGVRVEAGTAETDHTFTDVGFSAAFDSTPVVLGGAQTYRGADPIVTRQRDVSTTGMGVRVQEEQSRGAHVAETVGYVAIEPAGTITIDGTPLEVGRTPNEVTDAWYDLGFGQVHDSPRLLASMQTADGPDPAGLRYRNLSSTGVEVRIEEERSADSERNHTTESVGYVVTDTDGLL